MPTDTASAGEPPRAPQLVCVDPARVQDIWPHVAHLVRRAIARGGLTDVGAVERSVCRGDALLWLAWDGENILAAAVTELARIGRVKVCTIVACGGTNFPLFAPLIAGLERHAREEGCARMRVCGRRGWARLLADYSTTRIVLEKELL
jgi:hypothetical protein